MRIKIINPNTTLSMTSNIEKQGNKYARKETEIIAVSPKSGPESIESYFDEYLCVPGILEEIIKGDSEEEIDAYIIACFGDPGLYAAREVTDKPVIGIAQSAIMTARLISPSFSIVSVLDRSRRLTEDMVHINGASTICKSIRSTGLSVLEFDSNPQKGLEALAAESKKAVTDDGAECILLGCAGFVTFVEDLQRELGVPVLDGVMPAVKYAEALVEMGCRTSKILTWNYPEEKRIIGFSERLNQFSKLKR